MTEIDENGCIVFGPRSKTCPSWPVRIVGMQGLWRYISIVPDSNTYGDVFVEVIGPYFPSNPSRNGGRSRIFKVEQLKFAGNKAKPLDVTNIEATALSDQVKRDRRR